jgi:hypothetical protein
METEPKTMETLDSELQTLRKQRQAIDLHIRRLEGEQRLLRQAKEEAYGIKQLNAMRQYLQQHMVSFGGSNFGMMSHASDAYDIGAYLYPLCDTETKTIDAIPLPRNNIETKLYPHIVAFLGPHLPIEFEEHRDKFDDKQYFPRRNNLPVSYNEKRGGAIYVHYLK